MTFRSLFRPIVGSLSVLAAAAVGAAALSLPLADPAHAVNSKVRNACKDDYLRFCPNYEPDSTQARQCMRQVGKRLSPRCIDALADTGQIKKRR
ncbi:MAG: hypothetical protein NW216_04645 [Hyphomicrobium sp.]|nr:hypothetical protein [Hyphomicrobium sp.]